MLRALLERGVRPDLVVGTSVGAMNGALVAADPTPAAVERLTSLWNGIAASGVLGGSLVGRLQTLARTRTHLHSSAPLRRLLEDTLPVRRFEDLTVPFECVAASIERAAPHYFGSGPLVPALLASAAVPGLLPPVEVDGEHYLDGGVVDSIPLGRAIRLGADEVYVLQVGRVEQPLTPPTKPWEVALVAFEISRRTSFTRALADVPEGVRVHLLPTGDAKRYNDPAQLRYRDFQHTSDRIRRSYDAALAYLDASG
jgi:NTE family protein